MARRCVVRLLIAVLLFLPIVRIGGDFGSAHAEEGDWWAGYEENYVVIHQDTIWSGNITREDIPKPVMILNGATLTITPGTHVEIDRITVTDGRIIAKGTESEKIVFTKQAPDFSWMTPEYEQYDRECFPSAYAKGIIEFSSWSDVGDEGLSVFRYVEFVGMGTHIVNDGENCPDFAMRDKGLRSLLVNTAHASEPIMQTSPAILFHSGQLHIENSVFRNGNHTDIETDMQFDDRWESYDSLRVVNSNFEGNGQNLALISAFEYDGEHVKDYSHHVLLKNNWYGSPYGPSIGSTQGSTDIIAIAGDYQLDGWRESDLIADPVVVIPGITGSAKFLDEWELDPILHKYDDLMSSLERNGYQKEVNLFPFPYDWRVTNKTSALYLQDKIEDVIQKTGVSKVDVVAHSMGGLVARSYVEELGEARYADTIDQLITLGTPHRGSPEAYLKWEAGEGFFRIRGALARHHFEQEAEESGYDGDLMGYIRDKVVSVGELLPDDDYLVEVSSGETKGYPTGYPKNSFLEDLNDPNNVSKFDGIRFVNIVGIDEEDDTISSLRVTGSSVSGKWEHGMPENFYDVETSRGLVFGKGDQTVPEASAKGIVADETIEVTATHNELPTKAQCDVFRKLTGQQECNYDEDIHISNILLFNVFSPVDIQVVSPSGLKVGKDFDGDGFLNELPGAYYTGSDTKNEFVTIPNPENGEYRILARGTDGGGVYRIETTKIMEAADGDATESTAVIEGEVVAGVMEEDMTVAVSANAVELKDEGGDIIAPTVMIVTPESKTYHNSVMIPVSYSVSDDATPNEKLATVASLDGAAYAKSDIDAALLPLGAHEFSVSATDEVGNVGTAETTFTLDTSWGALLKNIDHYAVLGLLKNKGERQMLKTHIRNLGETVEFLEKYDAFFRFHPKLRDIFEREITHQLSILQKYVNQKSGKSIDPIGAARLIESMEFLKKTL
ncbi:MAG: alpha/beta hydrolase [Candidatus Moranbacteria bacterium]|nr:alpha/beta hydrolase [Candidatus Moranbacteria bacterium]